MVGDSWLGAGLLRRPAMPENENDNVELSERPPVVCLLVERFDIESYSDFSAKSSNFRGLVLRCIKADFCDQILIFQHFARSRRYAIRRFEGVLPCCYLVAEHSAPLLWSRACDPGIACTFPFGSFWVVFPCFFPLGIPKPLHRSIKIHQTFSHFC